MYGIWFNLRRFILFSIAFFGLAYVKSSLAQCPEYDIKLNDGDWGSFSTGRVRNIIGGDNCDGVAGDTGWATNNYCGQASDYCSIFRRTKCKQERDGWSEWWEHEYTEYYVLNNTCSPPVDVGAINQSIANLNQANTDRWNENVRQDQNLQSLNQFNIDRYNENVSQSNSINDLWSHNQLRFNENVRQDNSIANLTDRANYVDNVNSAQSSAISVLQNSTTDIRNSVVGINATTTNLATINNQQNTRIDSLATELQAAGEANTAQSTQIAGLSSAYNGLSQDLSTMNVNQAALAADLKTTQTTIGDGLQGVNDKLNTANLLADAAARANVEGHANTKTAVNDVNKSVKDLTSVISSQTNQTNTLLQNTDQEVKQGLTDWWKEAADFTNDKVNDSVNSVLTAQGLGEGSFNLGQTIIDVATLDNSGFLGTRPSTLPLLTIDLSSTALKWKGAVDLGKIKVLLDVLKIFLWVATWVLVARIVLRTE